MSYLTNGLSFGTLRSANKTRMGNIKYEKTESWSTAHWLQAVVGEVGELANLLKKVDRGDFEIASVRSAIADELADVVSYLDILSMKLGVDLGAAVKEKFNVVSERIGSPVYIGDDDDWHLKALREIK